MNITYRHFKAANEFITRLNKLRWWTEIESDSRYNELNKQALNCIAAFLLAKHLENLGREISYEKFPKIAIGRAFAKAFVYYDTPEHAINTICELGNIGKIAFDEVASQIIAEKSDKEFANFISEKGIDTEVEIYKAATKIATLVELVELEHEGGDKLIGEIEESLKPFYSIPGVKDFSDRRSDVFKLLQQISTLRNQVRWATSYYTIECSVLGHLFDTAVFAYLMAIEETNVDESYATKMFFMGIWHDVAETWTKDIPSPIKDRIEGYRKATEAFELKKMQENAYSVLPKYLSDAIKDMMFEEEENILYKLKVKAADYLSAASECWRNIFGGTRDAYFSEAILVEINGLSVCGNELYKAFKRVAINHLKEVETYAI